MSRFKSIAWPAPGVGASPKGKKITVPSQAMSLEEILQRFSRNEQVPVGKDGQFHESEDDLEKVAHLDLVEREEFLERQKATRKAFDKQEKAKAQAEKTRLEGEVKAKLEAELRAAAPPKKAE